MGTRWLRYVGEWNPSITTPSA